MNKAKLLLAITLPILLLTSCAKPESKEPIRVYGNNDNAANLNIRLAMIYLQKKQMPHAKQKLLLALQEAPHDPAAWYAMALYFETTNQNQRAKKYYLHAIKLAPNKGAPHNNYGTFLCRTNHFRAAIKQFLIAANNIHYLNTAQAYANAGKCALKIPSRELANKYFTLAAQYDPAIKKH